MYAGEVTRQSDVICDKKWLRKVAVAFNHQRTHTPTSTTSSHHGNSRCSQHFQKWHPFSHPASRHYNIHTPQTGQVSQFDALSRSLITAMCFSSRAYRFVIAYNRSKLLSWCARTDSQALVPCMITIQRWAPLITRRFHSPPM